MKKFLRKRVFIAINFSEEVKEKIGEIQKELSCFPAKFVKPNNLHLTLEFLGYLTDEEIKNVSLGIKEIVKNHKKFILETESILWAPPNKFPPLMIWLKIKDSEQLKLLKKDLDEKLNKIIGYLPEKREFSPHITLARIKRWEFRRMDPESLPSFPQEFFLEIPVNSIELMESILKKPSAHYIILDSYQFSF